MKLLQRTVKSYLIYSLLVLLVAIPLFYFLIQFLCLQDVDEALQHHKDHLTVQLKSHPEILNRLPWHNLNNTQEIFPPVNKAGIEKKITSHQHSTLSREDEPFRELHSFITVNNKHYPVILRVSLIDIEDLIQGIVIAVILIMLVMLVGLLWINRQQSKKLWYPFYQTLGELQHFNLNKQTELHFTPTNINEFKDLQMSITQLTRRASEAYLQQKEFTENAAHEIQSPLAALLAKIEILMQDETLTAEQAKHIHSLSHSIRRISRLNKGLLLLAKIENKQFAETEDIYLVPVVKRLLELRHIQIEMKYLTLSEKYENIVVKANPLLIDILLSNLINNAVRHTPVNGSIKIETSPSSFIISNTGDQLSFPEKNLFQRFQKGDHSEATEGNGLGLAIVKRICETCYFPINYYFKNGMHRFIIKFAAM